MANHSRPDDRMVHDRNAHRRVLAALLLLPVVGLLTVGVAAAQTPVAAGYRDFSYGTNGNSTPTGEKPESKVWWNDGFWWGSLFNTQAAQYHIYRFNASTQSWTDTGTVLDTRTNTKADVLWDEASGHLYVASHAFTTDPKPSTSPSKWGKLFRYTYDSTNRRYTLDAGFPVDVTRGTVEALTIAKDSTGRLWVTWVESSIVKINWSRTDDSDWGLPVTLPVDASAVDCVRDDISALIAFGGNKIGVIWSNQATRKDYFAVHRDADAPNVWQPIETVVPNPGCSGACADDHFNLKTDQQGKVYAAIKTSLTSSSQPLVMLAVRATNGTWSLTTFGREGDHHTRPIVLLDEQNNRLFMFATSGESGGTIYGKTTPLDAISFPTGKGDAYIKSSADTSINNVSSTKQNLTATTGLLIVASGQDTTSYFHQFVPLTGGAVLPPDAPSSLSASAASSTRINLAWTDASDNEDEFHIERATNGGSFGEIAAIAVNSESYSDTAVAGGNTYSYRVRAKNDAGFSAYSNTASASTPAPPPPPADPTNLDATAIAFNRVDLAWTDAANNETAYHVERATGGGSFGEIASLSANATSFSDTSVAASTTYQYRVRADNGGVFSGYSNSDAATTPAAPASQPIKDITFESGVLVDATTGVD
jgi:fibronectin type 3 domain-containing protein